MKEKKVKKTQPTEPKTESTILPVAEEDLKITMPLTDQEVNSTALPSDQDNLNVTIPSTESTTESATLPPVEEDPMESVKALQKEVAEKEQQINQQLEILWAGGTDQMLTTHPQEHMVITPSAHTTNSTEHQAPAEIKHDVPTIASDNEVIPLADKDNHEEKK